MKREIREGGFEYDNRQHMEWFIAMLLPHLRTPISHQTFESPEKTVEVAMKLEVAPREDTSLGVQKFRSSSKLCTWKFRTCERNEEKEPSQTYGAYDVG